MNKKHTSELPDELDSIDYESYETYESYLLTKIMSVFYLKRFKELSKFIHCDIYIYIEY